MQTDENVWFFNTTRVELILGTTLEHLREGLYTGANLQGVMGAGLPAEIRRAAGSDIERELRAQMPLSLGSAYLTSSGALAGSGVKAIAHGVLVSEPGGRTQLDIAINALLAGLRLLEEQGCRTIVIPQIGWRVANLDQTVAARELARVIVTHLRRKSRLRSVSVVSRHQDYLEALGEALTTLQRGQAGLDAER